MILSEIFAGDILPLVWVALAIIIAGLVQASAGIGFGLIGAPALLLLKPDFVPGAILVLGTLVNFLAAVRELPKVNRGYLLTGLSGRIPGAIVGASMTAALAPEYFGMAFGVLILAALLISVIGSSITPSIRNVGVAGFVSGVMGTLTSVGAPPMAIALQNTPGPEMRATMAAFLLFGALASMISLAFFGRFGLEDVIRAVVMVPCALLGFYLSRYVINLQITVRLLRPAVLLICLIMSVMLIVRSVLLLT